MKLKEFLSVCIDTDISIQTDTGTIEGTEYRYVKDYLDREIFSISTCGYTRIFVKLKEINNEA